MNSSHKIQKITTLMKWFCTVLMVALPFSVIWFWSNFEYNASSLSIARPGVLIDIQYISTYQLIAAATLDMLVKLVLVFGLWHLRELFSLFKGGVFFTRDTIRHLHTFGLVLFVIAVIKPVSGAILSLLLTFNNPPGQKSLVVEFGANEFSLLFVAGTFMAITWILREGQKLAVENAEFV